jgi:hypothetical protein
MEMSGQLHAPDALTLGNHWIRCRADPRASLDEVVGSSEHSNKPSGSIQGEEFLNHPRLSASKEDMCCMELFNKPTITPPSILHFTFLLCFYRTSPAVLPQVSRGRWSGKD